MRHSRLFGIGALVASFGWLLAGGCSSAGDDEAGLPSGSSGSANGGSGNTTVVMPDAAGTPGGASSELNPLCGDLREQCIPDDPLACQSYEPTPSRPGVGGDGSGGFAAAGNGAGGQAGEDHSEGGGANAGGDVPEQGGAPGSGGQGSGGEALAGAAGAVGGGTAPPAYGCQVSNRENLLRRGCELAGRGKVNAPCFSAADCLPSLACIREGEAGVCLPYCCDGDSTCQSGTYCAERALLQPAGSAEAASAPVPVCVPADDCSLEDAFPCPENTDCRCQGNTACMVVRADGTTTCLKPGTGMQGEACPCAWNHVCSNATQQCVRICRTDPAKNDCGTQKCQASSELPQNFGVCVGPIR
jgi:hypothetical protein